VVETLSTIRNQGESLAEVAHDARNMVTALGLYCELLEEPGVLATPFLHYGNELRLVASASRRLVEKLVALESRETPGSSFANITVRDMGRSLADGNAAERVQPARHWDLMPAAPISNLAEELLANKNLLSALAGTSILLTVAAEGGAKPVRLTGEDLTRVLVNVVKNAAEAMPSGGRIELGLEEHVAGQGTAGKGTAEWLTLTIQDDGAGIPEEALDKIFESGYTTRLDKAAANSTVNGTWPAAHRGLGLSISRSIVESAGGRIHAENLARKGARFRIELPVRAR
jgi:signal transduction histidine kinase